MKLNLSVKKEGEKNIVIPCNGRYARTEQNKKEELIRTTLITKGRVNKRREKFDN